MMHRHAYTPGPTDDKEFGWFTHSHDGGDEPHDHRTGDLSTVWWEWP